jgi:hypothetical protein
MPERRDISDALRDAVERTVQATLVTRARAQGAVDELAGQVDDLKRGAEKNITRGSRGVRAAVEDRLPPTQEDIRAIRSELRSIADRLEAIETRLAAGGAPRA